MNATQNILAAYTAGQENRDRTVRRNALANYAQATDDTARQNALSPLIGMGDFQTVDLARQYQEGNALSNTRREVAPLVAEGRYGEAANRAASAGQTDLAGQFMQLDQASLRSAQTRGQRGASVIYSALALPDDQIGPYLQQHGDLAQELGVDPSRLANVNGGSRAMLRSLADQWLDASKLAGEVSLQRFGDSVQTVRTGPSGSQVLDSREIPQTRAETLDRDRFNFTRQTNERDFTYQQSRDSTNDAYRNSRAEAEDAYRAWQMNGGNVSRSDVEGRVLLKAIEGGVANLTPEEKQVYDRAVTTSGGMGYGAPMAPPPGVQGAQPQQPAQRQSQPRQQGQAAQQGTATNPARPQSAAEAAALPQGTYFLTPTGELRQR